MRQGNSWQILVSKDVTACYTSADPWLHSTAPSCMCVSSQRGFSIDFAPEELWTSNWMVSPLRTVFHFSKDEIEDIVTLATANGESRVSKYQAMCSHMIKFQAELFGWKGPVTTSHTVNVRLVHSAGCSCVLASPCFMLTRSTPANGTPSVLNQLQEMHS